MFKNYIRLLKFLQAHKRLFILAVLTMFFASFFEIFQISLIVPIMDRVFNNKDIVVPNKLPSFISGLIDKVNQSDPQILFPVAIVCFIFVLLMKNLLVFSYQYLMGDVSQRIMRDIRYNIYAKIQDLSLDYFSERRTGELISRITHDVNLIENAVSYGVTDLFRQSFVIIMWVATAFAIDPGAAFIIFIIFPAISYPIAQIGKRLHKISRGTQEKMADINSLLLETISGIILVKAFCTESYEKQRFKRQNHDYYKLRMKSIKRLIVISPLTEIIAGFFGTTLMIWFGRRLMEGELSFGVFALFFASIMSIMSPVKKLGNVNAITQQALAANIRIYDVLDMQPSVKEADNPVDLEEMKREISIENVSFSYQDESEIVLKDINLTVTKGELVAIVGPTGTGKSTLVNLIPRFYDPKSGRVTMDDIDIRNASFYSLRRQLGIVTQETILFNDTVRANIAYGHLKASQEEIESAAKRAYAHDFIMKMPEGYDTIIGDRGFRLSGGEKQRIAIARAILKNPPILILDEATSQLDSASEKYVQEALDELMKGRTVVAIAHRLSTVIKADKIIVLDQGRIVGMSKHEELLKTCDMYKKLHTMQFQM